MLDRTAQVERSDPAMRRVTTWLGLAAIACYAIHGAVHLFQGEWYDLFWACHIAALFVGVGLLLQSAALNSVGVLLGLMGLPLWLADLAGGGEFLPTSLLTHGVALGIGLFGVGRLGVCPGAWWRGALALTALIGLCRLVTPAGPNVNVAFAIQHGWENRFGSHASYLAWMVGSATVYFFVVERLLRFLMRAMTKGDQASPAPTGSRVTSESSPE
jgi:hypothetical protein